MLDAYKRVTLVFAPNGAGKSAALTGEEARISMQLRQELEDRHPGFRSYSLFPQSAVRPCLSRHVGTFLASTLVLAGLSLRDAERTVPEMLNRFGFADVFEQDMATLSGGQDQIVHLLATLVRPASGTRLDSPFAMLDEKRRQTVWQILSVRIQEACGPYGESDTIITEADSNFLGDDMARFSGTDLVTLQFRAQMNVEELFIALLERLDEVIPPSRSETTIECSNVRLQAARLLFKEGFTHHFGSARGYVLTGDNGAGKSLLLRTICGLLPKGVKKLSGMTRFHPTATGEAQTRRIVYVPQRCEKAYMSSEPANETMQILGSLAQPCLEFLRPLFTAQYLWSNRPASEGSFGEVRFIAHFLAALNVLVRPGLVWHVADEPDASLDHPRARILARLFHLLIAKGKGVIIASHRSSLYEKFERVRLI
jgi:ABC-type Mn2+/Zn2+ transport system ATPase subunit